MTLIFDSYQASIGGTAAVSDRRKNCQLNIDLHYPSGWTYTVLDATYRGYVAVDPGVAAHQASTYYFCWSSNPDQNYSTNP